MCKITDGNRAEHLCKSCEVLLCEACAREHKRDPKTKVHIVQSLSKAADPEQERMASYFQNLVQDSDSMFDPSRFAAPLNYLHYSFALRQLAARSEGEEGLRGELGAKEAVQAQRWAHWLLLWQARTEQLTEQPLRAVAAAAAAANANGPDPGAAKSRA